jgi:chaperonin GroEL
VQIFLYAITTSSQLICVSSIYALLNIEQANVTAPTGMLLVAMDKAQGSSFRYNAGTGAYEDLVKAGAIDEIKVTRTALWNAASIPGLVLTTEAIQDSGEEGSPGRWAQPRRRNGRHVLVLCRQRNVPSAQTGRPGFVEPFFFLPSNPLFLSRVTISF